MTAEAKRWVLASRPDGVPSPQNFELKAEPLPDLEDGQVLAQALYFSVDPGMRSRLTGDSYSPAMALGDTIESAGIARIAQSRNPKFAEGDVVMGGFGWASHLISNGRGLVKLDPNMFQGALTLTAAIGVLGIPGLTAYFGLLDLGKPAEGETVLVSSAAGTVGATTGQIAKLKGLHAVGIAGGPDKCAYVESLGFDAAIDYRNTDDLEAAIRAACPNGVDIYLDNVGGEMLDAAIACMNPNGRIIISGAVSEYNRAQPVGIRNTLQFITHRLRMEGLVVFDYAKEFGKAQMEMAGWIMNDQLHYREQIFGGIEAAPQAFIGLFDGDAGFGRRIVKL